MQDVSIITLMKTEFTQYLFNKFLAWQSQQGGSRTQKEFAQYLGIGYIAFNQAFNGDRPPSKTMVTKLAEVFDDETVYDLAGMVRPDPRLEFVQRHWGKIPPDIQTHIGELLSGITNEPYPTEAKHAPTKRR